MRKEWLEVSVGIFLVAGMLSFGWLALRLGEVDIFGGSRNYVLKAEFDNISGLTTGASVTVAGVVVGTVKRISLTEDGTAMIHMELERGLEVPTDSMASVKSQGLIGDKYVQLTLGGDEQVFKPGEVLEETESSVDFESLISRFVFGSVGKNSGGD